MTFADWFNSLATDKQAEVKKVITPGYIKHLLADRRKVGARTFMKLKQIDPHVSWETFWN